MSSVIANLIILRKRVSTWILMGVWVLLGLTFAYLLPYLTLRGADSTTAQATLTTLLPENLIGSVLGGFPVFGGVIALMLGVLAIGSDYGWDTLKTTLSQRSGRLRLLTSKITAVGLGLFVYVLAIFATAAIASYTIATLEGATASWPSALDLLQAFGAGWFLLVIWAFIGLGLAVLSRGTALAIGLGVLYALLIESLLTALAGQVSWLEGLVEYSLRANAYSIVTALGVPATSLADNGPGSFSGPFVDTGQAFLVLCVYAGVFFLFSTTTFLRRDIA
ncbi:MAG TPA: ABC transporter permease subunit [Acidimicrobiia bacterium]|jgi:ABC-type transport system involved in multi-copper enzyme maturation permease subunit